jgi:hypothetical protein
MPARPRVYTGLLHFGRTFEADYYVSLLSQSESPFQLALLDYTHPSVPENAADRRRACF